MPQGRELDSVRVATSEQGLPVEPKKRSDWQTMVKVGVREEVGQETKALAHRGPQGDQGGEQGQAGAKVKD